MGKDYSNYTKENLIALLDKQDKELSIKKYGLTWDSEKEPEQVVLDCENNLPILERVKEKEIKTDYSDDNILIEGDNYHALTVLNYTHKEKIDVIYIDPPYNKGENDFIYNDKYINKDDGYKHSKWLNFMEKRLLLAKDLLKKTGSIFISIDDDEQSNLKLLCDKVFSSNNFVGQLIWRKKSGGGQSDDFFVTEHEYILVYAKDKNAFIWFDEEELKDISDYNKIDEEGKRYKLTKLEKWGNHSRREDRPTMYFPLKMPSGEDYYPIAPDGNDGRWRVGKDTMKQLEKDNLIVWELNAQNRLIPKEKEYWVEEETKKIKQRSILYNVAETADGSNILTEIFKKKDVFNNPKPIEIIELIFKHTINTDNAIVLDFFAGSGSTGHAVLNYNAKTGKDIKFILCTNNENLKETLKLKKELNLQSDESAFEEWKNIHKENWLKFLEENGICSVVTYPRISKVINGYEFTGKQKEVLYEKKLTFTDIRKKYEDISEKIENVYTKYSSDYKLVPEFKNNCLKILGVKEIEEKKEGLGGNLQYFKTEFIPVERIDKITDRQKQNLTQKAGQMIALKENALNEISINEWYQIFENNKKNKKTAIYFREDMSRFDELIEKIKDTKTTLYVFSYGRIDKKIFNYLGKNILIEDIPEPIIEIYKEINLTLKDK